MNWNSWNLSWFHVKIDSNLTNFRKSWNLPWSLDRSQYFQETYQETILENIVLFGIDNCHSSVIILHSQSNKFSNANLCLFFEANGWPNAWDSMPRNVCLHLGIKGQPTFYHVISLHSWFWVCLGTNSDQSIFSKRISKWKVQGLSWFKTLN